MADNAITKLRARLAGLDDREAAIARERAETHAAIEQEQNRERLAALDALRRDVIEPRIGQDSARIQAAAEQLADALVHLHEVCQDRATWMDDVLRQLRDLGVPSQLTSAPTPAPKHGGLGMTPNGNAPGMLVAVDRHRLGKVDPQTTVAAVVRAVTENQGQRPEEVRVPYLDRLEHEVPSIEQRAETVTWWHRESSPEWIQEFGPEGAPRLGANDRPEDRWVRISGDQAVERWHRGAA